MKPGEIVVELASPARREEAEQVAADLGLDLERPGRHRAQFVLRLTETRWELVPLAPGAPGPIYAVFGPPLSPQARRGNLLARALGRPAGNEPDERPTVVADATAGLGGDTWLLASLGYRVRAIERSAVVAVLLEDGLRRAAQRPETANLAARIALYRGDARLLLRQLSPIETILLDPMYPSRGKAARKAKAMQALRALVGDDRDAADLLEVARSVVGKRVLVKRSLRSPRLGGAVPSGTIRGSTVRLDIYPPHPRPDRARPG